MCIAAQSDFWVRVAKLSLQSLGVCTERIQLSRVTVAETMDTEPLGAGSRWDTPRIAGMKGRCKAERVVLWLCSVVLRHLRNKRVSSARWVCNPKFCP